MHGTKPMTQIAVETRGLSKTYGAVHALRSVDLAIEDGSYFVLLGPSGGGKTTLLRTVGGFIRPNEGRVLLHGRDVTDLPPNKRATSMVFQSFALFPHMTVERNVGYGLKLRRIPREEIAKRVGDMLAMLGLEGYEKRKPHELSGGQQQRVQLARSLVLESDVLLLDEPLAALDAKLRKEMCIELKRIQETVGITFIHVTHNQEEAMTVADRIAIIADGEVIEDGPPRDIYERPRRRFTAGFIGDSNLLDGTVVEADAKAVSVDLGYGTIEVPATDGLAPTAGQKVAVSLRSEIIQITNGKSKAAQGMQTLPATFREQVYLGLTTSNLVRLPDGSELLVRTISNGGTAPEEGSDVTIGWKTEHARLHVD